MAGDWCVCALRRFRSCNRLYLSEWSFSSILKLSILNCQYFARELVVYGPRFSSSAENVNILRVDVGWFVMALSVEVAHNLSKCIGGFALHTGVFPGVDQATVGKTRKTNTTCFFVSN